jgi:hypothetical protein
MNSCFVWAWRNALSRLSSQMIWTIPTSATVLIDLKEKWESLNHWKFLSYFRTSRWNEKCLFPSLYPRARTLGSLVFISESIQHDSLSCPSSHTREDRLWTSSKKSFQICHAWDLKRSTKDHEEVRLLISDPIQQKLNVWDRHSSLLVILFRSVESTQISTFH